VLATSLYRAGVVIVGAGRPDDAAHGGPGVGLDQLDGVESAPLIEPLLSVVSWTESALLSNGSSAPSVFEHLAGHFTCMG
jgi:hypothetical protein